MKLIDKLSKNTKITNWSKHLIICLRRFKQIGNGYIKNNKYIDIPLLWRHNYELQGAVIHFGNVGGGHYVYVGKHNNEWYEFNDSSVSKINLNQLKEFLNNAYLLNYLKKE